MQFRFLRFSYCDLDILKDAINLVVCIIGQENVKNKAGLQQGLTWHSTSDCRKMDLITWYDETTLVNADTLNQLNT